MIESPRTTTISASRLLVFLILSTFFETLVSSRFSLARRRKGVGPQQETGPCACGYCELVHCLRKELKIIHPRSNTPHHYLDCLVLPINGDWHIEITEVGILSRNCPCM